MYIRAIRYERNVEETGFLKFRLREERLRWPTQPCRDREMCVIAEAEAVQANIFQNRHEQKCMSRVHQNISY